MISRLWGRVAHCSCEVEREYGLACVISHHDDVSERQAPSLDRLGEQIPCNSYCHNPRGSIIYEHDALLVMKDGILFMQMEEIGRHPL